MGRSRVVEALGALMGSMKTTHVALIGFVALAMGCASAPANHPPSALTPQARCEAPIALRATLPPSFCDAFTNQYFWDGARCAQVTAELACTCGVTRDCGPYFGTVDACEVAHAHCR